MTFTPRLTNFADKFREYEQRIYRLEHTSRATPSSRRYKELIQDAIIDPAEVLALSARTWRMKAGGTQQVGFIAEELDELPTMKQFVVYDRNGQPDAIDFARLTAALLVLAQSQHARLEAVEAAVSKLVSTSTEAVSSTVEGII